MRKEDGEERRRARRRRRKRMGGGEETQPLNFMYNELAPSVTEQEKCQPVPPYGHRELAPLPSAAKKNIHTPAALSRHQH